MRIARTFRLALAVAAVIWFPLAYLQRQDAALAAGERRIEELRARVPGREQLLAQERELADSMDMDRALLSGSTPAVAAAQLQGDLAGLAAAMGGEITTVQILEPEPAPPPSILPPKVTPNYTAVNALLEATVTAENSDGVKMQLDNGDVVELTQLSPGEFGGQIAAFTAVDNGQHSAIFTPYRGMLVGESLGADYVGNARSTR